MLYIRVVEGRNLHPPFLALIDYRRHHFARSRFSGREPERSSLNHLAFEVPLEELSLWKQRLQDWELEVLETEFPGLQARALFFEDPEGNRLELISQVVAGE